MSLIGLKCMIKIRRIVHTPNTEANHIIRSLFHLFPDRFETFPKNFICIHLKNPAARTKFLQVLAPLLLLPFPRISFATLWNDMDPYFISV